MPVSKAASSIVKTFLLANSVFRSMASSFDKIISSISLLLYWWWLLGESASIPLAVPVPSAGGLQSIQHRKSLAKKGQIFQLSKHKKQNNRRIKYYYFVPILCAFLPHESAAKTWFQKSVCVGLVDYASGKVLCTFAGFLFGGRWFQ